MRKKLDDEEEFMSFVEKYFKDEKLKTKIIGGESNKPQKYPCTIEYNIVRNEANEPIDQYDFFYE